MQAYRSIFIGGVLATISMAAAINHYARTSDPQAARQEARAGLQQVAMAQTTIGRTVCLDGRAYRVTDSAQGSKVLAPISQQSERSLCIN